MKKVFLALLMVLASSLSITTIFGAARVGVLRIPDRPMAEQYNQLPWYACCCCMERINSQFMDDVTLTHDLLTSFSMTSPNTLRELFLKCTNNDYTLSEDIARQLNGLGFLDEDHLVKITWRYPILCSLLPRAEDLDATSFRAAVEDLARKFPHIITQLRGNLNDIPRASYTTLFLNYRLIATETEITPEEVAKILRISSIINHTDLFISILTLKSLDDVFYDMGMVVFVEDV